MKRGSLANDTLCMRRLSVKLIALLHLPVPFYFSFRPALSPLKTCFVVIAFLNGIIHTTAQQDSDQQQAAYKKTIQERVTKIVNTLDIADAAVFDKTVVVISGQYFSLNNIHENSKAAVAAIKTQSLSNEEKETRIKKEDAVRMNDLLKQHDVFIASLNKYLTADQVEKVKDGMTYRILPITYAAYLDMLPQLNDEQKSKIYLYLQEARELAMDAESSEKKHAVFGKYKGRINNYLSAAGFNMKKEGEEWQKRIKEREAVKKDQKAG
jgi:hypothetical protein